jgi:hypothetical protein
MCNTRHICVAFVVCPMNRILAFVNLLVVFVVRDCKTLESSVTFCNLLCQKSLGYGYDFPSNSFDNFNKYSFTLGHTQLMVLSWD